MNAPVNVYVDGFNLYFGALKSKPHLKWLDLRRFSEALYEGNTIGKVYYFTADIHRQDEFDLSPSRQTTYLKAAADYVQFVKNSQLEASQFPKSLIIGSGRELVRPREWS
jgi:hypothetical protein